MNRKYELIRYLFNHYLMYFESEYSFATMTFYQWIREASKCDYYKKEILELKELF